MTDQVLEDEWTEDASRGWRMEESAPPRAPRPNTRPVPPTPSSADEAEAVVLIVALFGAVVAVGMIASRHPIIEPMGWALIIGIGLLVMG